MADVGSRMSERKGEVEEWVERRRGDLILSRCRLQIKAPQATRICDPLDPLLYENLQSESWERGRQATQLSTKVSGVNRHTQCDVFAFPPPPSKSRAKNMELAPTLSLSHTHFLPPHQTRKHTTLNRHGARTYTTRTGER